MSFKVLSVFAQAGLKTDDELFVVVEQAKDGTAREVMRLHESELFEGHGAETLRAAFALSWKDVRAPRVGTGKEAYWQLEVKRHPEFDGGQSGWESSGRVYVSEGRSERDEQLFDRRVRHAMYLMALNPEHMKPYLVKDAMNTAAQMKQAAVSAPVESLAEPVVVQAPVLVPAPSGMAIYDESLRRAEAQVATAPYKAPPGLVARPVRPS